MVSLLQCETLAGIPHVAHGFSTRLGGVSAAPWDSLNLAHRLGDDPTHVEENRTRLIHDLGRKQASWVSLKQVHGDTIVQVSHMAGRTIEADGLWTADTRAAIAVLVADCVPILMAAESGEAVAAVHAGWRGTRARIAGSMCTRLNNAGFDSANLRVGIGPAIGPCCYEVGDDVADALREVYPSAEDAVRRDGSRLVVDLWALNVRSLVEAGISPNAISVIRRCTRCDPDFFSHRGDDGQTGRQCGIIVRKTPIS